MAAKWAAVASFGAFCYISARRMRVPVCRPPAGGRSALSSTLSALGALLGLIFLLLSCAPAAAQISDDYSYTAVLQYGPFFPPGVWVPVRMEIRNTSANGVRGYAMLPIEDDAGGVNI